MKFVMSYSGGKDGALALWRMLKAGHTPVAILTTLNQAEDRSWFHGLPTDLLEQIAVCLDLPLIACPCLPEQYESAFEAGLSRARALGATACCFGDIDIAGHKDWNLARCQNAGLSLELPLWQANRARLTQEGIDAGFKSLIKIIKKPDLTELFLGQTLSHDLVAKIAALGADPCGENGEYHTIVYDGPIFKKPLPLALGKIVDLGSHAAIEVSLAP